jgi:L-aminopeptidase/D-esterase-like protein
LDWILARNAGNNSRRRLLKMRREMQRNRVGYWVIAVVFTLAAFAPAQNKPRARDLGIPFDGTPGPLNAITDVKGVEVGFTTLISGKPPLKVGVGPIQTGVTAILPRGIQSYGDPVLGGYFSMNGNGEMTGMHWLEESGLLPGPVMITNTHSVGIVRDGVIEWMRDKNLLPDGNYPWAMPIATETYDGRLNDINGFHVHKEDAFYALDSAKSGPVAEGNVGGGTGMVCYQFKGGTGTSSRKIAAKFGGYTVGVLVQCNCGGYDELHVAGIPVGRQIVREKLYGEVQGKASDDGMGSIIIVVATDAPLMPTQLKRLARRAAMGLAWTGTSVSDGDGDIFLAFSTANSGVAKDMGPDSPYKLRDIQTYPNDYIDELFAATAQATEEAIINAMIGAETTQTVDGKTVLALPHDQVREILKKYNRLNN